MNRPVRGPVNEPTAFVRAAKVAEQGLAWPFLRSIARIAAAEEAGDEDVFVKVSIDELQQLWASD